MKNRSDACSPATALRAGFTVQELFAVIIIVAGLATLLLPMLARAREAARNQTCRSRLRDLTLALHAYHDVHQHLPAAAIWSTDETSSLALHVSRQVHRITRDNWTIQILPFLQQVDLQALFRTDLPIGAAENEAARTTSFDAMTCPSDDFNRPDNPYRLQRPAISAGIEFARGNFGINGGTHNYDPDLPSTTRSRGERVTIVMLDQPRRFEMWGNGIAGFNKSFSLDDFTNGQSTLVAIEELRAGVHPLDPRGVWALGQVGGSITWAHGVNGDAFGPNNPHLRSDDILGCAALQEAVGGAEQLQAMGMPCVNYMDNNQQATSRSRHPGGTHVAFLDGSVRFIANHVDPGLWHVMHSRETPGGFLDNFDARLLSNPVPPTPTAVRSATHTKPGMFENSIGMRFVTIPAGEFVMGLPNSGHGPLPEDLPRRTVVIARPYLLSVHEATREQFQRVMSLSLTDAASGIASNLPVTDVSWDEAVEFCRLLGELPEERRAGRSYRLPTEAEWEYACRAGSTAPYHWRRDRREEDVSGEAAGIYPPLPLASVGSWPASPFGLHDMRGNAWEWTADWFVRDFTTASGRANAEGPRTGYLKVVRGGDWRYVGEPCVIDYPHLPPWKSNPVVGFRVVCETLSDDYF